MKLCVSHNSTCCCSSQIPNCQFEALTSRDRVRVSPSWSEGISRILPYFSAESLLHAGSANLGSKNGRTPFSRCSFSFFFFTQQNATAYSWRETTCAVKTLQSSPFNSVPTGPVFGGTVDTLQRVYGRIPHILKRRNNEQRPRRDHFSTCICGRTHPIPAVAFMALKPYRQPYNPSPRLAHTENSGTKERGPGGSQPGKCVN